MSRPRSAPRRRCHRRASSTSPWRPSQGGRASAASHRSPACRRGGAATCAGHVRAACRASVSRGRRRGAQAPGPAWCSVRSGVHRSGRRAHRRGGNRHRAGRGRATPPNPLATRCLRRAPRTAGCLFSVRGGSSGGPGPGRRCAGVAVGYPSTPLLRCCPQRPLLLHTGDESRYFRGRGRPRRARRARGGPARRAGPATGHRSIRQRPRRSGAGRAAADHRMAATRIARGGIRRRRNLAADQHHHRGCGGHHVDRRVEKPWRALHHHVLATARRPHLERGTA